MCHGRILLPFARHLAGRLLVGRAQTDGKRPLTIRFLFAYILFRRNPLSGGFSCPSHKHCSPNSIRKWQTPAKFSNASPTTSGAGSPTRSPERSAGSPPTLARFLNGSL